MSQYKLGESDEDDDYEESKQSASQASGF